MISLSVLILSICGLSLALDNGLARTPQMGWNSWNFFGCSVNENVVMAAADAIVSSGLADLGYIYVNVDDCWAWNRSADGVVNAEPTTFPHGMEALASYVHSKNLKFGLYSDAGPLTCGGRPGSLGYEQIDAKTYASWGVDYLKYDNCNALANQPPQERYPIMRDALNASGADILFSMCEWGVSSPWFWANEVGNSWRTDNDIGDNWDSFIRVLDDQIGLSPFAGAGGWNDPDMLEVGNGGMYFVEYKSQFALWCLLKAPLLIGCDLTSMTNETFFILSAEELIAVNQDPLGIQGDLITQQGPDQVWAGPLADGSRAFILFNRHTWYDYYPDNITVYFTDLGYPQGTTAIVRDLYAEEDVGTFTDSFTATVVTHDVFAGKITPTNNDPSYINWRPKFQSNRRPMRG